MTIITSGKCQDHRDTSVKLSIIAALPGIVIAGGVNEAANAAPLTAQMISGTAHIISVETGLEQQIRNLDLGMSNPQLGIESDVYLMQDNLTLGSDAASDRNISNQEFGLNEKAAQNSTPSSLVEAEQHNGSDLAEILAEMRKIKEELSAQKKLITDQKAMIDMQNEKISQVQSHNQMSQMDGRQLVSAISLSDIRGTGMLQDGTSKDGQGEAALPDTPVGEAPPEAEKIEQKVEAVPEGQGVLTPKGSFVLDPSFEYSRSSTNRLVFRGIELIPGVQIGTIEASDAHRDTLIATMAGRFGLSSRLEIEGRVPLLFRRDRIEVVQQRDDQIVREIDLEETDIGDAELSLRYQLNRPRGQQPIWVAGLRVKSDTGISPYEIPFDSFGVATGLATGSGFWGVQPSISFLLPSDPVVLYGGLSYLWNVERNVDRVVGDVRIGKVDPGDAISGNVGFGFALNPRFSFSLGYSHSYLFATKTELGGTTQESKDLQVGTFNFGMSYRLTERRSLNLGFKFGVTEESPDVGLTVRVPFMF
jgi:hypothetical protein